MENRFERIFKEGKAFGRSFEVWRDSMTGVCYLLSLQDGGYPCMTPLLGSDGKPLVMQENGEGLAGSSAGDLDWTQI